LTPVAVKLRPSLPVTTMLVALFAVKVATLIAETLAAAASLPRKLTVSTFETVIVFPLTTADALKLMFTTSLVPVASVRLNPKV
jgi:hypothetical protein